MILIGYEVGMKAYRCYDPNSKLIPISRDVSFEEESQWDWSVMRNQQIGGTFSSPIMFDFINFDDEEEKEILAKESSIGNGDHDENLSPRQIDHSLITKENSSRKYKEFA